MRTTTSLPRRSSMSVMRTDAPSRASVSLQASPMPEAPPVTMAPLPARRAMSAALPVAGALLGIGLDAFLEVLGLAQPILLDELALGGDLGAIGEEAAHRLAGRHDGKRRGLGDRGGEL